MSTIDGLFSHLGLWQVPVMTMSFLSSVVVVHHYMAMNFLAPRLDHWCSKPEEIANWIEEDWKAYGIPKNSEGKYSQCLRYMLTREFHGAASEWIININETLPCTSWMYNKRGFELTLVDQFDLVCEKSWLVPMSRSIFMAGVTVGVITFSHISDWYGRKLTILVTILIVLLANVILPFANSFELVVALQAFAATGVGGLQTLRTVTLLEFVGPRTRGLATFISSSGWSLGMPLLSLSAYFVRDWSKLHFIFIAETVLLLLIWAFVPESPRWLMMAKKYEQASKVLSQAVRWNKIKNVYLERLVADFKDKVEKENACRKTTISELFSSLKLGLATTGFGIMSIAGTTIYFTNAFQSSVIGSNAYLNLAVMGLAELPHRTIVAFFIRYFKRRTNHIICYSVAGISALIIIFVPNEYWGLQLFLLILQKAGGSMSYDIRGVHVPEVYPTTMRTIAAAFIMCVSRTGAAVAPFVKELGVLYASWIPSVIIVAVSVVSIGVVFLVPETFNIHLPDLKSDLNIKQSRTTETSEQAAEMERLDIRI